MDGEATTTTTAAAPLVPLERLEAEITELAGQLAAGECRWLELVAEYDRVVVTRRGVAARSRTG